MYSKRFTAVQYSTIGTIVGGVQPQKTQTQNGISNYFWVFWVFWVFLEKGVESTYLNIPDHLRPTCFLHFFREISPGSDT